jgi:membrane dipeptidase
MDSNQFHQDVLVWDAHRDVAYEAPMQDRFLQGWITGFDMHLPLLRAGGMSCQTYAICVAPELDLPPTAQAFKELELILDAVETHPEELVFATHADDVLKAKSEHKLAAWVALEGAEPILNQLDLLRAFYRMGVRSIGLTWNVRNAVADGVAEGRERGGGLTQFGETVVREMNKLGMVIDVAHMTLQGVQDVLKLSEQPIIVSHGGSLTLSNHRRTSPDYILEAIAKNGGVFCGTTIPETLADDPAQASINTYIDLIDHCVHVIGADHVGLGADFDVFQSHLGLPPEHWLSGLEEVDRWPAVTAGLMERGYSEADIRKIMGENLLRVYRQVVG